MNILTSILYSKDFFQIHGSHTFPCQGPPKLHVFGRRPPYRYIFPYIFKDLNKCSRFFQNSRSSIQQTFIESGQNIQRLADIFTVSFKNIRSPLLVHLLFSSVKAYKQWLKQFKAGLNGLSNKCEYFFPPMLLIHCKVFKKKKVLLLTICVCIYA